MTTQLLLLSVSAVLLLSVESVDVSTQHEKAKECMSRYNDSSSEMAAYLSNIKQTGLLVNVDSTGLKCLIACLCQTVGLMTPEGDIVIDRYMSAMTTKLIELSDRMGRKIVMDEEGLKQEVAKCDANEKGSSCTSEYQRLMCVQDLFKESNMRKFLLVQE